jgi:hypothetical protein
MNHHRLGLFYFVRGLSSVGKAKFMWEHTHITNSNQWIWSFTAFFMALAYTLSYLPYGKFYNPIGGNFSFVLAYLYIFSFLGLPSIRYSWF